MSKYYKVDDVSRAIIELPDAENGYSSSYDKAEILNALEDIPTIEGSEDCISKAYLEQELEHYTLTEREVKTDIDLGWNMAFDKVFEVIEDAPSVIPSRAEGEWIRTFDGNEWYWYCSSCKEQWYEDDLYMGGNEFPNFCPNCGAKMKG